MPANTLTEVTPKLLAGGLAALREFAIMPQLVNRQYDTMAGEQGSTIDVPIPSAIAVQDVTPAVTAPDPAAVVPTSVPIQLNRWKEAPFQMSDKDRMEIMRCYLPVQATEAIKGLANEADQYLLSLGSKFYGFAGAAGTTPFGNEKTTDATAVRTVLNRQVAPMDPRHVVLDPDAEGSALNVRAFQDASFGGGVQTLLEGDLNRKLGFRWWMDQNVQTHNKSNGAGYLVNDPGAALAVGDKSIPIDTGTGTITTGDIITFAGHTQTYVVTAAISAPGNMAIEPGLAAVPADNAAITIKGSHVMNLAFHRDAIAFATRPLAGSMHPSSIIEQAVDEVSGLVLRLEVTREYKRDRFSYDVLYGGEVVRRELGARLAG